LQAAILPNSALNALGWPQNPAEFLLLLEVATLQLAQVRGYAEHTAMVFHCCAETLPALPAPPHSSADKVADMRQLATGTDAADQQKQQSGSAAAAADGAAEAASEQALSKVLDMNEYAARSLIDQEPALLDVNEKQLKVRFTLHLLQLVLQQFHASWFM
jgi:hypothetical protein